MDVYVYEIDLPMSVHEMVTPDTADDGYTVYINRRLSDNKKFEAYHHALRHCISCDFERADVQQVEVSAHKKITARCGNTGRQGNSE